jgi:hypothetical protein
MSYHSSASAKASPALGKPPAPKTFKEGFLGRLLDPLDRIVEAIYSVLIVLTFTLAARSILTQTAVPDALDRVNPTTQLFWAALGCALAWGLIDGAMYVLTCVFERGQDRRLYKLVRNAVDEDEGAAVLAAESDTPLSDIVSESELRAFYGALYQRLRTTPPPRVGFEKADFAGGLGIFLVAVGAALPLLLPLVLFPGSEEFQVRASNFVAFIMLFLMGYRWGVYAGGKPWLTGLLLLVLGVAMMIVAIPLGG